MEKELSLMLSSETEFIEFLYTSSLPVSMSVASGI
jgi:hypothetical protein